MSRRKARETAFKILFEVDQADNDPRRSFELLLEEWELNEENRDFAWSLIEGTLKVLPELDEAISQYTSQDWSLDRMASVDRALLRLAAYEMRWATPPLAPAVVIDEAVELAKRYSDINSVPFINAVLDRLK